MKRVNAILIIILILMAGCGDRNKQSTEGFITVDVTKSYPKKELILQDIMDVEYIPLETTNDFLTQGLVLAIGKDIIIVRNNNNGQLNDGRLKEIAATLDAEDNPVIMVAKHKKEQ